MGLFRDAADREVEPVTMFRLDPVVAGMSVGDLRIVLEDVLEGCESDAERVDAVIEMLMP